MERVRKTQSQRIRDCESHLYFLWDSARLCLSEPDRYKQVAAELRVLVATTKTNTPLLLTVMDDLGVDYTVHPPQLPFVRHLPTVAWQEDLATAELSNRLADTDSDVSERARRTFENPIQSMSLRDYISRGLAMYIKPKNYSWNQLVLAVSQQMGSSHEDEAVEVPLQFSMAVRIGGFESYIPVLLDLASVVLRAGAVLFEQLAATQSFELRHPQVLLGGFDKREVRARSPFASDAATLCP